MKEDARASKDNEDAFYNSQKFEVLYCGKVTVTHKKAPSSLIDDCIEKFSLHELQRLRIQGEQRAPEAGDDPGVFEAEGPGSPTDLPDDGASVASAHLAFPTAASQPGLPSPRLGFPERILEDSGFDEQQEFRSRCSSVTGVLQRRVHENSQKPQPRRRHASAPSHVQPSDSEKNRTMLFQVLCTVRVPRGWQHPVLDEAARRPAHALPHSARVQFYFPRGKPVRQVEKAESRQGLRWARTVDCKAQGSRAGRDGESSNERSIMEGWWDE